MWQELKWTYGTRHCPCLCKGHRGLPANWTDTVLTKAKAAPLSTCLLVPSNPFLESSESLWGWLRKSEGRRRDTSASSVAAAAVAAAAAAEEWRLESTRRFLEVNSRFNLTLGHVSNFLSFSFYIVQAVVYVLLGHLVKQFYVFCYAIC